MRADRTILDLQRTTIPTPDGPCDMNSQITVRARDCLGHIHRPSFIGDVLAYRGQEWVIVGLFMGADPITSEIEEYLVLEGRYSGEERRERRGVAL